MTDQLREALDVWVAEYVEVLSRHDDLLMEPLEEIVAAARRFLALTETEPDYEDKYCPDCLRRTCTCTPRKKEPYPSTKQEDDMKKYLVAYQTKYSPNAMFEVIEAETGDKAVARKESESSTIQVIGIAYPVGRDAWGYLREVAPPTESRILNGNRLL